jgi:hypothetical protein
MIIANQKILQAVKEVIEEYESPESPEGFACAMYQLKRIYNETNQIPRRPAQRIGPPQRREIKKR